jgi:hypothetical protein
LFEEIIVDKYEFTYCRRYYIASKFEYLDRFEVLTEWATRVGNQALCFHLGPWNY